MYHVYDFSHLRRTLVLSTASVIEAIATALLYKGAQVYRNDVLVYKDGDL